jgi:hypothetical protein
MVGCVIRCILFYTLYNHAAWQSKLTERICDYNRHLKMSSRGGGVMVSVLAIEPKIRVFKPGGDDTF